MAIWGLAKEIKLNAVTRRMNKLYQHQEKIYNTTAAEIVVPVILDYFSCNSVLDVGCGTGTWLKIFRQHGVRDVVGIDSPYVDKSRLLITDDEFIAHDLTRSFNLRRRFDVLLCLEVAEHLPDSASNSLIESLCSHSNTIVFSAAIPGQGGQYHVNEQWSAYWQEKFQRCGYERFDIIRPKVWDDARVDLWYKQNIFVFSNNRVLDKYSGPSVTAEIHPNMWNMKIAALKELQEETNNFDKGGAGIARSWKALLNAIKNRF